MNISKMDNDYEILTQSPEETIQVARDFGEKLTYGDILCLYGPLGAGKTTFMKGIALGQGLENTNEVKSPTFVVMHIYETEIPIYHLDCYRIEGEEGLVNLGLEDLIGNKKGIICLEWPEKAKHLLKGSRVFSIFLEHESEFSRKVRIHLKK